MSAPEAKKGPNPMLLIGMGLGIMLLLIFVSEGLKEFFINITVGLMNYRQVKSDFIQFLFYILLFIAIAMLVFKKKDDGDHH